MEWYELIAVSYVLLILGKMILPAYKPEYKYKSIEDLIDERPATVLVVFAIGLTSLGMLGWGVLKGLGFAW